MLRLRIRSFPRGELPRAAESIDDSLSDSFFEGSPPTAYTDRPALRFLKGVQPSPLTPPLLTVGGENMSRAVQHDRRGSVHVRILAPSE